MSRQTYFYRVPPQELHRRTQLQPEPAKTKALQTVIEMKVRTLHVLPYIIFVAWTGYGWGGVNFPYSSLYSAMF